MSADNTKLFSGLDEIFAYKNQLMTDMLTDETIVRLLDDDCKTVAEAGKLVNKQVFPFEFVPDVTEHGQTFICCDVDIKNVSDKTFLTPVIYVWIFTHKSKLLLPEGGVRTDKLSSKIVEIINGSRYYGLGELDFYSAIRFSPISQYQGRILTFYAKDFNRVSPTGKAVPANRRVG